MQKIEYVNYFLDYLFGEEKGGELRSNLSKCINNINVLRKQVKLIRKMFKPTTLILMFMVWAFFLQATGRRTNTKSDLDRYLQEECEPYSHKFDILNWWKVNSIRFPILGNTAHKVLAIPVSTVVSEFAFSTGGRVLNPYQVP
ncbi:hypothetical protein Ahy_B04g072757 [Arachis hypogaea]|uniref:HAT C-terminal dimerisation domain-containing protein n=1 Tax=Arachis hypogaea TaxID=3818 RepID=A0A444ZNQ9_ARAHY|nr:hypothetical protein Ahy_B04g072757 [Arachis hypogaea]